MFTTTVAILRAPLTGGSRYASAPVRDWDDAALVPVPRPVSLQPQSTGEGPVERPAQTDVWLLVTEPPGDLDLRAGDRVRVDALGVVLEVDGTPRRWPDIDTPGLVDHVEATLKEVRG